MAKQQETKEQCKAVIYRSVWQVTYCSRPAGHGLGAAFCKQHAKQGEAANRNDLKHYRKLLEVELNKSLARLEKARGEVQLAETIAQRDAKRLADYLDKYGSLLG